MSEWGPNLELAKPKSSDRRGRRTLESSYGTAPHLAQCMRPGGVARYLGTSRYYLPRPGIQALLQPMPTSHCSHLLACWCSLSLSLVCCTHCLCFINRPSRRPSAVCRNPTTMTMDGRAPRFLTAPCVLRAPCAVGFPVCSPASCSQRCSPGDGAFVHALHLS